MEFHEVEMQGPLKTDNIRASDGTLAATISDSTGDVTFQNDVEVSNDLDVDRDATIFRNLEVQGPLVQFIQDFSVGGDTDLTGDLTVGGDTEVIDLKITGGSPGADKVLISDASGNTSWQDNKAAGFASVPTGQSILFYTNDTVLGYTIDTALNDDVVYVTKGSIAGGESGGTAKSGGTWTQPTHIHGLGSITVPEHNHKWMNFVSKGSCFSWASNGTTQLNLRSAYGITGHTTVGFFVQATSCNANNPAGDFWTQNSGAVTGDAGDTDAGGTVNTWRPKGRNFTLQQRN